MPEDNETCISFHKVPRKGPMDYSFSANIRIIRLFGSYPDLTMLSRDDVYAMRSQHALDRIEKIKGITLFVMFALSVCLILGSLLYGLLEGQTIYGMLVWLIGAVIMVLTPSVSRMYDRRFIRVKEEFGKEAVHSVRVILDGKVKKFEVIFDEQ